MEYIGASGNQTPVSTVANKSGSTSQNTGGTTASTGVTSQVTAANTQNMTPEALAALNALVASLSDRPTISAAKASIEATKRGFGTPTRHVAQSVGVNSSGTGPAWDGVSYSDYLGRAISKAEYNAQLEGHQNAILQIQKEGGITPGGTQETKVQTGERATEIQRNRDQQAAYSKNAAFADAATQTAKFTRQLMETIMPALNKAVESSGTSGGATAGLIANDAAAREAETAAALGLQSAAAYGTINANLSTTLEALTRSNPIVLDHLLTALNVSKGAVSSSVSSSVGTEAKTASTSQTQNTSSAEVAQQLATPVIQSQVAAIPNVLLQQTGATGNPNRDPFAGYTPGSQIGTSHAVTGGY